MHFCKMANCASLCGWCTPSSQPPPELLVLRSIRFVGVATVAEEVGVAGSEAGRGFAQRAAGSGIISPFGQAEQSRVGSPGRHAGSDVRSEVPPTVFVCHRRIGGTAHRLSHPTWRHSTIAPSGLCSYSWPWSRGLRRPANNWHPFGTERSPSGLRRVAVNVPYLWD